MTERVDALRQDEIDIAILSRPGNHGLDPKSYTAQRLQHASPQHLHLTSRRCFIGPIPDNWLSRHRKTWYQYRPRQLQTYSSKAATFTAGETYADLQQLSGLDGVSGGSKAHILSFPQPTDVDESEPHEHEEETGHDGALLPEANEQEHGQRGKNGAEQRGQKPKGILNDRLELPKKTKAYDAKDPTISGGKSTADTFRTAEEFPDEPGPSTPRRTAESAPPPADYSPADTERSGGGAEGNAGTQAERSNGAADAVDSTSSLLPRGKGGEGSNTKGDQTRASNQLQVTVTAASGDGSEDNRSEQRGTDPRTILEDVEHPRASEDQARLDVPPEHQDGGHPDLRRLDPVSTGLVRFDLPTDEQTADTKGSRKISEARILKSMRDLSKARAQPGELLKAERMLVRVDATRSEVPAGYTENDSLGVETRLVEKWREFIVVCRRTTEPQSGPELVLRMETTRVIPVLENARSPKKPAHEIPLSPKTARINMYSSLDKTIVIWAPYKKDTRIYLFRPKSFASSVEWYTFLHKALGWKRSPSVTVHVPDLNMTVEIEKPFEELKISNDAAHSEDVDGTGRAKAKREAEGQAAQLIIDRSLEMLKNSPAEDVLKSWVQHEDRIGLAWKRYDRLEWVHGANEERMYGSIAMSQTHDLELRPKTHYPTQARQVPHQSQPVEEPPAVEGFLVRLTSQQGRGKRFGRQFSKRLYYSTHNQYFCFSTPGQVVPPKPPNLSRTRSGQMPTTAEIAEKTPLVYMVDPYPLGNGQISWLSGPESGRRKEYDLEAYEESERTVKALMDADGYINLCHVVRVHRSREGTSAPPAQGDGARDSLDSEDTPSEDETQPAHDQATFELTMRNGLAVRLQAYSKEARQEWVKRLRAIARYWRMRLADDMLLYQTVRQTNLQHLDIDEGMEAYLGQYAHKWEVARAVASPELFHVCGISCCRAVTMAGVLYYKPRLHGTFKKCNALLVHGRLLLFQATLRSRSGKEIPHIHHERQEVVDLRDTYVYSGLAIENDLLYRNQTFESNHPGHHALPRIWLDDHWTSIDEDTGVCFVLWRSQRKSLFRARVERDGGSAAQTHLARVSRLGATGRAAVFKTRSRTERDRWVTSIGMEIERLQQGADIRVVPKK